MKWNNKAIEILMAEGCTVYPEADRVRIYYTKGNETGYVIEDVAYNNDELENFTREHIAAIYDGIEEMNPWAI